MKKIILAALAALLLAAPAQAKDIAVARAETYTATFTDEACRVPSIAKDVTPEIAGLVKHGRVEFKDGRPGRQFCYVPIEGGVFVEDDAGFGGAIDESLVKPLTGV